MGEVFFTADTHFGHRNIIAYANRPFASVEEMDEVLIERWNERVRPHDVVYHLGDFSLTRGPRTGEILGRLHGEIHIVWGNHDRPAYAIRERFASCHDYLQITVEGQFIVCFHYALRVWNKSHRGSWQRSTGTATAPSLTTPTPGRWTWASTATTSTRSPTTRWHST